MNKNPKNENKNENKNEIKNEIKNKNYFNQFNYKKELCTKNLYQKCWKKEKCKKVHSLDEFLNKPLHLYKFNYNFFIFHFKTEICPINGIEHDKNLCVYAHNINDFKRFYKPNLKPQLCSYWKSNNNENNWCKNGFNCCFCHNEYELNYHPLIYKTKNCNNNKTNNKSKFCNNIICWKYHNSEEQRSYDNNTKFLMRFVPKNLYQQTQINKKNLKNKNLKKNQKFKYNNIYDNLNN